MYLFMYVCMGIWNCQLLWCCMVMVICITKFFCFFLHKRSFITSTANASLPTLMIPITLLIRTNYYLWMQIRRTAQNSKRPVSPRFCGVRLCVPVCLERSTSQEVIQLFRVTDVAFSTKTPRLSRRRRRNQRHRQTAWKTTDNWKHVFAHWLQIWMTLDGSLGCISAHFKGFLFLNSMCNTCVVCCF